MTETQQYTVPMMFPVVRNKREVFLMYSHILENPELQHEVTARALAELHDWLDRYGDLIRIIGDDRLRYLVDGLKDFRDDTADLWPQNPGELLGDDED